jgi:hypothetical protein
VRDTAALIAAQQSLRNRFEDFRRAFDRRDGEAYRVALADFQRCLQRWTAAIEAALLPALLRAGISGRDPRRELRLDCVQVRELTRFLAEEIARPAALSDLLGLLENLARRFAAHDTELTAVYFPAAAPYLTPEEWSVLENARPTD